MPHLDSKYTWEDLFREIDSGLFKDAKYITIDSISEIMRDLEGEIVETMD